MQQQKIKKERSQTDTLNVRSGAGTSYSIISKVHKGDTVNIVGRLQMDGTK